MKQELKEYLQEVVKKLGHFEADCREIQGYWNGDESGVLEEEADDYKQLEDELAIARRKLEYVVWGLKDQELNDQE